MRRDAVLYSILRRVLRKVLQNTTGLECKDYYDLGELRLKRHKIRREKRSEIAFSARSIKIYGSIILPISLLNCALPK